MKQFTLNQVQDAIETAFNAESIQQFRDCLICEFDVDGDTTFEVKVVLADVDSYKSAQGIHLHDLENETDLGFHVADALNSCFRDGFQNIWIHTPGGAR